MESAERTLQDSRRRLLVWLGAVFALVNLTGPALSFVTFGPGGIGYWSVNLGSSLGLAVAAELARRGYLRIAASVIGFFASATPLVLAYTSLPPTTALLTTAFATVGITIAANFGRAWVAAAVATTALVAILALPSFRADVRLEEATVTAFLVLVTSSLAAIAIRMREHSARALARAATSAARSEATFRAIAQTAPVPIVMVSVKDNRVRFANGPAARLIGVPVEELIGASVDDLMKGEEQSQLKELFDELRRDRAVREHELMVGDRWLSINASVLRHDDEEIILSTLHDITPHMEAAATLITARDAAELATETRTNFLANISHELRTPLNGVHGMLRLLADTPLSQEQLDLAERAQRSADSLLHIIDGVLDFAKIEAGKIVLEDIEFDVEDNVRGAMELVRERALAKAIRLDATLGADVPRRVRGDPTRLRQVLLNMLSNAVKFTDRGSVELRCSVAALEDGACSLRFVVEDTGIGIEPEDQVRLFEAFQQADPSTTRRHGGTGLGLAISRELIELMGGEVDLRSVPGEGTTVFFTVKVAPIDEVVVSCTAERGKLLLAEDDETNRLVARHLLERMGYEVEVVVNGEACVSRATREGADYVAILMDCQMPVLDGIEATVRIRAAEHGERVPIVALTAHDMDQARCSAAGMDGYLRKPLKPERLQQELARVSAP